MTAVRVIPASTSPGRRRADGLDALHVLALELHAVLVLDDLRQLDEVERVDVEGLELGVGVIWSGSAPNSSSAWNTLCSICSRGCCR